jgi:RimJ/RimL family protein N-acetyltransferase
MEAGRERCHLGLFMLVPENAICWKVHTCLLPLAWGKKAKKAARQGIEWVWKNMPAMRLVTDVPAYNRQASIFARWAGMTQYGLNPKSYQKNGKLMDVILLGISKPEAA